MIFLSVVSLEAQLPDTEESNKHFRLMIVPEFSNLHSRESIGLGINAEVFVHENFSLNYRFAFTPTGGGTFFHFNSGWVGSWNLASIAIDAITEEDDDTDLESSLFVAALVLFALPEGVSFHIPVNENATLSPFINPLGMEIIDDTGYMTFELGLKLTSIFNENFCVSPYFSYKTLYYNNRSGFAAGFAIGIAF